MTQKSANKLIATTIAINSLALAIVNLLFLGFQTEYASGVAIKGPHANRYHGLEPEQVKVFSPHNLAPFGQKTTNILTKKKQLPLDCFS